MSPRSSTRRGGLDANSTEAPAIIRSEEELEVGRVRRTAGTVRARKFTEHAHVEELVPRGIEHAEVERALPDADDDGEIRTLADGSVSIPIFEEQLVVEKRLVVRERFIIRKHTVIEHNKVEADLRVEQIEVDADVAVAPRVRRGNGGGAAPAKRKPTKRARPLKAGDVTKTAARKPRG